MKFHKWVSGKIVTLMSRRSDLTLSFQSIGYFSLSWGPTLLITVTSIHPLNEYTYLHFSKGKLITKEVRWLHHLSIHRQLVKQIEDIRPHNIHLVQQITPTKALFHRHVMNTAHMSDCQLLENVSKFCVACQQGVPHIFIQATWTIRSNCQAKFLVEMHNYYPSL